MGITQLLDPLRAQNAEGMPVLIVALAIGPSEVLAIVIDADGQMGVRGLPDLKVDFRYDWKNHAWVDAQPLGDDDGQG